jgi:tetrahydromethanopterin S-methyltransferase subunit F
MIPFLAGIAIGVVLAGVSLWALATTPEYRP